jgi:hypothetical protein
MTVLHEAFMLLVLDNNYDMWLDAESNKVGRGRYTENAANRKFCGWSNEGMHQFNELIQLVKDNRNNRNAKQVEEETFKTLAKRYKSMLGVNCKNSQAKHHHVAMQGEDDDSDDSSIEPQDELHLMVAGIVVDEIEVMSL